MDHRHLMPLALVAALAACDGSPRREQARPVVPEPTPSAVAAASNGSIMRPSVVEEVETAPEAPPPPPEPVRLTIGFPNGGARLDEAARAALDALVARPDFAGLGAITLRGHSDSTGDDAANLRASARRAEAVREYLSTKGIDRDRITVIALGERRPIAPNARLDGSDDEAGMRRNRRVEVEIAPAADAPTSDGEGAPPNASEPAD